MRIAATSNELAQCEDAAAAANLCLCYVIGRWHLFVKSGFAREPMEQWPQQWPMLLAGCLSQPA